MSTPIIAAIISSTAAIIGPFITYILIRLYDERKWGEIRGRRKALVGKWAGELIQEVDGRQVTGAVEISFTAGNRRIEGLAEADTKLSDRILKLKFVGGFLHDSYVKLDYTGEDEVQIQFGCYVGELSADASTLKGHYVGYSSIQEKIVFGIAILRKQS